jgi:four helix bundle protein
MAEINRPGNQDLHLNAFFSEGHSRNGTKEFMQFLGIAKGSLAEVQTQLIISENLGFAGKEKVDALKEESMEIAKLLNAILRSLAPNP